MKQPEWTIREEQTSVPGWPATFYDWFIVVNPHGGRMSFTRTRKAAEESLRTCKAEWFCDCGQCPRSPGTGRTP